MITETPVNAGHAYASSAEEYEDTEDWAKAAEAHSLAAQEFQKAIEFTQDIVASKTLRLLAQDHLKKAKELERKHNIQKLQRQQGHTSASSVTSSRASLSRFHADDDDDDDENSHFDMDSLRHALSSDRRRAQQQQHLYHHHHQQQQQHNGRSTHGWNSPAISGSYAVLPPDGLDDDDDDESDPFNKFFQVVEKLVDKLSNPVAFASVPLHENDNPTPAWASTKQQQKDGSSSSDDDDDDDYIYSNMMESYFVVPGTVSSLLDVDTRPVPTTAATFARTPPPPQQQQQDYLAENDQLKKRVEQLTRQIQTLEKAEEERNMLKSSILQFRDDVQKHAKRIMQNNDPMRSSSMLMSASSNMYPSNNSNYMRPQSGNLVNRIKELEEENRQLKIQNEKQQALMNKYRERWEKLKESAKKKRAQPDQDATAASKSMQSPSPPSSATSTGSSTYTTCSSETVRGPTLLRSLAQQSPFPSFGERQTSTASVSSRGNFRN